eukprot:9507113-Alexandrium_andersonii.AAC.1
MVHPAIREEDAQSRSGTRVYGVRHDKPHPGPQLRIVEVPAIVLGARPSASERGLLACQAAARE